MRDYDETVAFLAEWGRFQQVVFFLLCASSVLNGINTFYIVFAADMPAHQCLVPPLNLSLEWANSTIPLEVVNGKEERSSCSRYRLDLVRNLSAQGLVPGRDVNLTELQQESCLDGWSYSKDIYQSTLVTQFHLVCSERWKQPFTSTIFLLGVLCGSFFSGQLSDRFGRKPVLFGSITLMTIAILLQVFSTSWTMFSVFFFISGVGRVSSYISAFVLGTEVLTGRVRVLFSALAFCVSFSLGYMLLPLLAFFLRDWKSLVLAVSLLNLLYLPLWWLTPESPRWLLSQGRAAEAEAVLRKAARMNQVEAPEIIFTDVSLAVEEQQQQQQKKKEPATYHNVFYLVKTSNIRRVTLIVCLVWWVPDLLGLSFTIRTGYYGLSFNTSQLHANRYLSCFMSAAVEIPAYVFIWLTLWFLRRRLTVICILVLGGVSLLLVQLVPEDLPSLAVALEMLGKFAVTAGSSLMYVYTTELYPTVLRNTATAVCSILSRVGSSVAPFLFQLSSVFHSLPYVILGFLSMASALAALFLPETFGKPLPQTVEQMPQMERLKCPPYRSRSTPASL